VTGAQQLRVDTDPATGVVVLRGELTYATVATLDDVLRRHLPGHPHLVLDLAAVAFCDSAGLAALIGATRRAERLGGDVTLAGARAPLHRMLRLTGVEPLFAFRRGERADAGQAAMEGRGEPA
jgi:anti-sigma B factor antagonist